MIAAWMMYCVAVALVLAVMACALEQAFRLAGRATRWAWAIAVAGSLSLPLAAWLRPEAFTTLALPAAAIRSAGSSPAVAARTEGATVAPAPPPPSAAQRFAWSDFDGLLRWGWGASSAALFSFIAIAAARLVVQRRRWAAAQVDGHAVLVSDDVGPAVGGLWPPRVIVPGWALKLPEEQRRLLLVHEVEHVRARDPWLLAAGMATMVLTPWNIALWWLVRRLRLAVEVDCDGRVLRHGHQVPAYGELLLHVGHRRARSPLGAPALGESRSFLEHRIRRLTTRPPRWRWAGVATAAAIAIGALVAACETPRPVRPEAVSDQTVSDPATAAIDSAMAVHLRPRIHDALQRYYPDLLTGADGPPVDVWFGHDARLQVTRAFRRAGTVERIGADQIRGALPEFRPGHDGWSVLDRLVLNGLVRDNVRVVWVYLEDVRAPDGPPEIVSAPALRYPQLLQLAGIRGHVLVRATIDTTGRAVASSVQVVESSHPGFNEAATRWVLGIVFRPARADGRAVRGAITLPIDFISTRFPG